MSVAHSADSWFAQLKSLCTPSRIERSRRNLQDYIASAVRTIWRSSKCLMSQLRAVSEFLPLNGSHHPLNLVQSMTWSSEIMPKPKRTLSVLYSKIRPPKSRFLPPEVWLAVFENGGLGPTDISNVRLTCTSFASLARSQAFFTFDYTPFILTTGRFRYRFAFTNDLTTQRLERLDFWASDDTAPMVRRCRVHPVYMAAEHESVIDHDGDASSLIDAFFRILPKFVNIFRLECQHMPFSDLALAQLITLRQLTTLYVEDCNITAYKAPSPSLRVPNVHFVSVFADYGLHDVIGNVGWLDVLQPEHIRRIEISLDQPAFNHLRGIVTTRTLVDSVPDQVGDVHRHILSIISHASALEELSIIPFKSTSSGEKEMFPEDFKTEPLSLLSLRSYDGPHQFLSAFVPGPNLQSMSLTGCDKSPYTAPDALLETFHRLDALGREPFGARTLTFSTSSGIPDALLTSIGPHFPHLKHLKMRAKRIDEFQVCLTSGYLPSTPSLSNWHTSSSSRCCRAFRMALRH